MFKEIQTFTTQMILKKENKKTFEGSKQITICSALQITQGRHKGQ